MEEKIEKSEFDLIISEDELKLLMTNDSESELNSALAKYDSEFFKQNHLLIIKVAENSSSIRHEIKLLHSNTNAVIDFRVGVKRIIPEGELDTVPAYWSILVPINWQDSPFVDRFISFIYDGAPVGETELERKFNAMSSVDSKENSITVITKDFLKKFWQSNYFDEKIHSLTTEEVCYIIEDSIRIYSEYDKIILPSFKTVESSEELKERIPVLEGKVITPPDELLTENHEEDMRAIHDIIIYRLEALSSPEAMFSGAEVMLAHGYNPIFSSSLYPMHRYYIPGYSENTDRDAIMQNNFYNNVMNDPTDELFIIKEYTYGYGRSIFLLAEYGYLTPLFPTLELEPDEDYNQRHTIYLGHFVDNYFYSEDTYSGSEYRIIRTTEELSEYCADKADMPELLEWLKSFDEEYFNCYGGLIVLSVGQCDAKSFIDKSEINLYTGEITVEIEKREINGSLDKMYGLEMFLPINKAYIPEGNTLITVTYDGETVYEAAD